MERKVIRMIKEREEYQPNFEESFKKISGLGWKIIEVIGNYEACLTSEIYKKLRVSGRVFKQEVKKLADLNLVGWKKAKLYKQKAIFHFLTRNGELAFLFKFRKMPEEKVKLDKKFLEKYGIEKKDGKLILRKEGKEIEVFVEDELNKVKISNDVKNVLNKFEGYFICASDKIKNCVLEEVARQTFLARSNFLLFLLSPQKGDFEKIEFLG